MQKNSNAMKQLFLLLISALMFSSTYAQDELPVNATIHFAQFDKAVKNVAVDGYTCTITAEDSAAYSALFTCQGFEGAITAFNIAMYELITSSQEEFVPVKEYDLFGKKAYLGTNNYSVNGETPMHVLVLKYSDLRMTLLINTDQGMPIETLERIVKNLVF